MQTVVSVCIIMCVHVCMCVCVHVHVHVCVHVNKIISTTAKIDVALLV